MSAWAWFWTAWLVVAGVSFAVITAIVSVRGFADLRQMFRMLSREHGQHD